MGPLRGTGKFSPSPPWHRNQTRSRAKARVEVRSGVASEDQTVRLQKHHGSTLPKAMTWYGWKLMLLCWVPFLEVGWWALVAVARPRKVRRKPRASLVAAPDAEVSVRNRIEALKTELYTRDPPCVQMSKLHGAIGRIAKQVNSKREALAKATAALAGAKEHYKDLLHRRYSLASREEGQDFYEENDYDTETDRVGEWSGQFLA